jgi:hypothetical protein
MIGYAIWFSHFLFRPGEFLGEPACGIAARAEFGLNRRDHGRRAAGCALATSITRDRLRPPTRLPRSSLQQGRSPSRYGDIRRIGAGLLARVGR